MATNFPSSLDSFTNPTAVDTLDSPPHDTQHADANDAIEALQAKVGVDGSAVTTSLDYKVANLESRPVETKTASYTLAATDVNKRIVMNSASATTITVDDAVFSAGDTVWIHNIGAGTTTVTAGTATVNTAGSLDVGQWEGGSLYFTSASSAIFFRGGGAGVANANFTNTATGTYTDSGTNYKYLTFNSSGTITIDTEGLCDILVVGGGGSGGLKGGGGGGAGGHLYATGAYLPVGTHTVTVGAGGASVSVAATEMGKSGLAGTASQIQNYISPGGGGGGGMVYQSSTTTAYGTLGNAGGSGGGGSGGSGTGGTGFSGIGNDGGTGSSGDAGGGGGGAGADGANAASGSTGGAGLANSITGSSVTRGGGGGGGRSGGSSGGSGGGGAGSGTFGATAGAGTPNTGGGGGGQRRSSGAGYYAPTASASGPGGSGVVIIRVEV